MSLDLKGQLIKVDKKILLSFVFFDFRWCSLRVFLYASSYLFEPVVLLCLYWIPSDIQFITFSLVVVFYGYNLHRNRVKQRKLLIVFYLANTVQICTTISSLFCCTIQNNFETDVKLIFPTRIVERKMVPLKPYCDQNIFLR